MVILKTVSELAVMREGGKIASGALELAGTLCKSGVTTGYISNKVREYIEKRNARPSFLGYNGFKGSACISVNDEVIHGIPGKRMLADGDIVSVDIGAFYKGYHADNAYTFKIGSVSSQAEHLIKITKKSLEAAINMAMMGYRLGDISNIVQSTVEREGYSAVQDYVGHGIGRKLHESPEIPNFGKAGKGIRLVRGMTLAIEPMINAGKHDIYVDRDGWTVKTKDGSLSAHFEHTVAITDNGPAILTINN
ncbi:MAG: type I methionyl aminopeptidase [Oscillospiraceae bacterium]|nr:type I methionyl aminopeptidase [Oscillospiraceae bacterium]